MSVCVILSVIKIKPKAISNRHYIEMCNYRRFCNVVSADKEYRLTQKLRVSKPSKHYFVLCSYDFGY